MRPTPTKPIFSDISLFLNFDRSHAVTQAFRKPLTKAGRRPSIELMPAASAGLLMYRIRNEELEFLLVHPGGPFWKSKDTGAWTIPKGEIAPGEDPLETAQREFCEELGFKPEGQFIP